jgi:serine/threonine protein kinase
VRREIRDRFSQWVLKMGLVAGSQFGPYLVQSLVHEDGIAEVYRARDTRLNCDVALQLTHSPIGSDGFVRFMEACRRSALFSHPNVLAVYDFGWHDGRPFIVSELLQGETLRARMASGRLATVTAAAIAIQIADGLEAAHRSGFVHAELRPENIFVSACGRVKLLNFSPPRSVSETLELFEQDWADSVTRTVNALSYMSPEQAHAASTDHRTDIFSLGAILYEMVTGVAPFRRNSPIETLLAVVGDEPPLVLRDHPGVPLDLRRVIGRCLEKDPDRRIQSAQELRSSLERTLPALPAGAGSRNGFMAVSDSVVARVIADSTPARGDTRKRA